MNQRFPSFLVLVVLAITFSNSCIYIVKETERAVKLHFGSIVEADIPPGIHLKWPMADKVHKFDARILTLDAEPKSFLTREKKRLIVDAFAKWRIKDV
ncbi:MAG: protease modulator HflC, partial [Gammaproteobacteria bacterium]